MLQHGFNLVSAIRECISMVHFYLAICIRYCVLKTGHAPELGRLRELANESAVGHHQSLSLQRRKNCAQVMSAFRHLILVLG